MSNKRFRIGFLTQVNSQKHQAEMLSGVVDAAIRYNADVIRLTLEMDYTWNDQDKEKDNRIEVFCKLAEHLELDGLLVLGWICNPQKVRRCLKNGSRLPIVALGIKEPDFLSLYQNGHTYIRELVSHLVEQHHAKRIAYIEPLMPDSRIDTYTEMLIYYELYDSDYIVSSSSVGFADNLGFEERARRIIHYLYDRDKPPPDAIMSMHAEEAVSIIRNLRERNIRVPKDVAVTSWEESDLCRYNEPPVTTVYYPFYELGYAGCDALARTLQGEDPGREIIVPGRLIMRESCGCISSSLSMATTRSVPIPKYNYDTAKLSGKNVISELNKVLNTLDATLMFTAFEAACTKQDAEMFTQQIDKAIKSGHISLEQLRLIQSDLLAFRQVIRQYVRPDTYTDPVVEDIWLKAQIIIENRIEKILGEEEMNKTQFSFKVEEIGLDLITAFNMAKIREILDKYISRIRIPRCFIYSFTQGDGREMSARLLFCCGEEEAAGDARSQKKTQSVFFDNKLLFSGKRHTYLLHALRIRDNLLGCVFFEHGVGDDRIYLSLATQLSSAIHGAMVLEKLQTANEELKAAEKENLAQMELIKVRTEELEQSNQKLANLDNLKNDFIANITHDFRSPLMIILNNLDLCSKYEENVSTKLRQRLKAMYNASLKLKSTIDQLLDLAKMDAQGIKLNVRPVQLNHFLEGITDFYKSAVNSTGIRITSVFTSSELYVYTDPVKLEEVLNNLISNSLKFVDPRTGQITIAVEEKEEAVRITIADNGIGIPPDKLEAIFGRFEQIDAGKNNKYKGTGIGLAFSRQLISYLHGKIWAESAGLGKGAKFIIELRKNKELFSESELLVEEPLKSDEQRRLVLKSRIEAELAEASEGTGIFPVFSKLNGENEFDVKKSVILIVDDNRQIREIVWDYLHHNGYENFIFASDGLLGVEAAYKYRPDLIICDYNMPNLRGDAFHDELINNPDFKQIPFIFLSAVADKGIIMERKKKGAIAYLSKPVDESDLLLTIELHLNRYMELKATMYQAMIDELTKINNKRNLMKLLNAQLSIRRLCDISFIFMDLDHFKFINDKYGHQSGDAVLAEMGTIIRETIRQYDIAGRYGGEEFLIVLPETSSLQASIVAIKLKKRIEESRIHYKKRELRVTASFGIASLFGNKTRIAGELGVPGLESLFEIDTSTKQNWEEINSKKILIPELLINLSDKALYNAKRTVCRSCSFHSEKTELFEKNTCPQCGSSELDWGRNKISVYDESM